ncbi:N-6 DNA methylase [Scandinavium sp. NPDC088450]|uniref:N-6 DNA methylase n=1 Tax=Scandinavium sp. NPDC088450 TaxID=3364514 RepID=UPI00384CE77F
MSQLSLLDLINAFEGAGKKDTVQTPVVTASAPSRMETAMLTTEQARKKFISVFNRTGRHLRRWDVFSDFITLAASEIDLARVRTPENIERARKICDRYETQDMAGLHDMFGLMVTALQGKFHDFLGSVFMELEMGSGDMGQFFTPYHLQALMARMVSADMGETISQRGWIDLSEPTCGAGGMVIAYAECMLEAGFNPFEQLFASCIDIDPIAADMAFIQLGLLGIPSEVITGNTLTQKFSRVRYTPAYYFNHWQEKRATRERLDAMREFLRSIS